MLTLTITLDVAQSGFVVEISSPPLLFRGGTVTTCILVPVQPYDSGDTEEYLTELLVRHLRSLGIPAAR